MFEKECSSPSFLVESVFNTRVIASRLRSLVSSEFFLGHEFLINMEVIRKEQVVLVFLNFGGLLLVLAFIIPDYLDLRHCILNFTALAVLRRAACSMVMYILVSRYLLLVSWGYLRTF